MDNLYRILLENKNYEAKEMNEISKDEIKLTSNNLKEDYDILGIVKGVFVKTYEQISEITDHIVKLKNSESIISNSILNAHNQALSKMEEEAVRLNADGIIGINMKTIDIMGELVEFFAYGTAIKFKKA